MAPKGKLLEGARDFKVPKVWRVQEFMQTMPIVLPPGKSKTCPRFLKLLTMHRNLGANWG